jgi:hypothetical protein
VYVTNVTQFYHGINILTLIDFVIIGSQILCHKLTKLNIAQHKLTKQNIAQHKLTKQNIAQHKLTKLNIA